MQRGENNPALKRLTLVVFLLVCAYSLASNIIGVTTNPMIEEFSLTGASQGLMSSMISLGNTLPLLIIPFLQGRIHKIWLIIFGCAMQAAMLLLTGISGGFTTMIFACVLLGVGNNFADSCCNSYIVDLHPGDSAKYLNLLHGFFGIGGLVTPLLISWVISRSGWRASYYVAAALFTLIFLIFTVVTLKNRSKVSAATPAAEKPITAAMFKSYITTRRNLMLLIATIFYAASQIGIVNWIVHYMSVRFDAAELGSVCMSVYWVCVAICRMFCSRLPFKPHKMLVAGAAAAGVFNAIGVISGSPVVMLICTGLLGLFSGLCIPVTVGEAALGNEDKTGLTTSALYLMMGLSRIVTPLAMGAAAAKSISAAMMIPAAAALVSALFCALANRDRPAEI